MDQTTQKKEKPKLNLGFGIGLGEYSSAVVIGIISGVLTAGKTIRDKFWDDVKHGSDFKDHWEKQDNKLKTVKPNLEDATIGEFEKRVPTRKAFEDFSVEIRKKKKELAEETDAVILERRAVRKSLIAGTFDRAKTMSRRSTNGILLNSIAGMAFGAVMTLGFFNGIATRAKINAIDNAVEPETNQPPEQKIKPYKDREALDLPPATSKAASHVEKLGTAKVEAAKEERPKSSAAKREDAAASSHVSKLEAESADQGEQLAAAR